MVVCRGENRRVQSGQQDDDDDDSWILESRVLNQSRGTIKSPELNCS